LVLRRSRSSASVDAQLRQQSDPKKLVRSGDLTGYEMMIRFIDTAVSAGENKWQFLRESSKGLQFCEAS
jgi:hypothetical protein